MAEAKLGSTEDFAVPDGFQVLVVDDDEAVRKLLVRFLRREGFAVLEAEDGESAWDIVHQERVDLVITDVAMPRRTGTELLRDLRVEKPDVMVIIMTGMPNVDAAVECIKIGAFDYLSKPFDLGKLSECVWAVVRQWDSRRANEPPETKPGSDLGEYRIIRTLGEGTSGIVFLAEKDEPEGTVHYAVKIVKLGGFGPERQKRVTARFLHECEAAARIAHPNVVRFVSYGLAREENIPYLVTEFFPAPTLKELLPALWERDYAVKVRVIIQVAKALGAIHAQDICHRDIKPSNVLVDPETLLVKISDFGVAQLPDSELTNAAHLMGTPAYMAPEVFVSSRVDHLADIFSLGVLSYELLVGRRPFNGETVPQLAHQIPHERPVEPKKVDPHFPVALQAILARMLKKDSKQRYASADDIVTDLQQFLDGVREQESAWRRFSSLFSSDWG